MNDDQVFRLILLAGFVTIIPVAAYHRIKAATNESLDRLQEGIFILVSLRLMGFVTMAGLIAYMIDPSWMAWSSVPLPTWLRWLSVPVGLSAALLLTWTLLNLGKNLTDTVVTRQVHTLVTTGPYRWVRHPFYVAVGLALLANSLATANWYIFLGGSMVLCLLALRTRIEESNLIARFGDDYRQYMERTGRFWPTWRIN